MAKLKVCTLYKSVLCQYRRRKKADYPPEMREGGMGPGLAFAQAFGEEAEIVATIICGDSYFNEENVDTATETVLGMIREKNPDGVICGPCIQRRAVRRGVRHSCRSGKEQLGIPVVTGMYKENPGADMYKNKVYICETKNSAAGMRRGGKKMAPLALKLVKMNPSVHRRKRGICRTGIRVNFSRKKTGAGRAVDMLVNKLNGREYVTEYPMPSFDRVEPGPAIKNMAFARIALVTSGGIVPKGNPDHIESSSASKYGCYNIEDVTDLTEESYETAHGGYDPSYANQDADRVLPVDIIREFFKGRKNREPSPIFLYNGRQWNKRCQRYEICEGNRTEAG